MARRSTGEQASLLEPSSIADAARVRLIAQAEHLAETHLQESDPMLDLGERETAFVVALDHDFDAIAVAAGFAKQTIAMLAKDPGA